MDSLHNDLTCLVDKFLPITYSVLLTYDRSDHSKYTNLASYTNKLGQALQYKHQGWINYCFRREIKNIKSVNNDTSRYCWYKMIELYEFFRFGKAGLINNTKNEEQRRNYIRGLAKGQHKDLFLMYFNSDITTFESLMGFKDYDFIMEIINKHYTITPILFRIVLKHQQYQVANKILEQPHTNVEEIKKSFYKYYTLLDPIIDGSLEPFVDMKSDQVYYTLMFMKFKHLNFIDGPEFFDQLATEYFAYSRTIWNSYTDEQRALIFMNDQHDDKFDKFVCSISPYVNCLDYQSIVSSSMTEKDQKIYRQNKTNGKVTKWYLSAVIGSTVKNIIISSIIFQISNGNLNDLRTIILICLEYYGVNDLRVILTSAKVYTKHSAAPFLHEICRILGLSNVNCVDEARQRFGYTTSDRIELLKYFIMNTY